MFAKICASSLLVSALCLQVTAHALISPGLGFPANPTRSNVQRPSSKNPCGNIDIASQISTSTPVIADANGEFQANVTSFNGGKDGSREVTAKVDPTGQGKNFQTIQVITNGNGDPASAGTEKITAKLPEGIQCENNDCLVQVETTAGFGNCIVVKQQGGDGNGNDPVRTPAAGDSATGDSTPSNTNAGGNAGNCTDGGNSKVGGNNSRVAEDAGATGYLPTGKGFTRRVSGRHMARLLADLRYRGEEAVEIAK
jgi:hypothetical protein